MSDEAGAPDAERVVLPWYSYAFQPIVDVSTGAAFAYEALVRGARGEPAGTVFARVPEDALFAFDAESRLAAVALAGRLGIRCRLSVNALPRSVSGVGAGASTAGPPGAGARNGLAPLLAAARHAGLRPQQLIVEITESEAIDDHPAFAAVIDEYRGAGLCVAIDDFGAGYAGLNLLADLQPDLLKLDMALVRGIEGRGPSQSIVRAILMVCDELGIDVIAEGIETAAELAWLTDAGVRLCQGYLLGRPMFERLPAPTELPELPALVEV